MATVYIKPGTGSGSGTLAAPYFQSEINTAEAAAGNNGIIYFVDGTYTLSNETWDAGVDNITYKSLNKNGAILTSAASITLRFGASSTTQNVTVEDFKISGYIGYIINSNVTIKGISQADTASFTPAYGFLYKLTGGATLIISESSFSFKRLDATQYFFRDCSNTTVTRCTFHWSVSAVGANKIQSTGTHPTVNNSIIASDLDSAINSNAMTVANYTNCCISNMDHTSGGTDNIFSDPLLVDPANSDLRLRPSSPCINAGTAS
jgi:hypothetical protein